MRTTRSNNGRNGQSGYASDGRNGARRGAAYNGQAGMRRGYAAPAPKAPPRHASVNMKPLYRIGFAVLILAIAVVIAVSIYQNVQKNNLFSNTFTPGVTINGDDVSGRDVEEVRAQLKANFQQRIADIAINITYGDKSWTLTGADLGASDNVDKTVDEAAKLAREGTAEQRAAEARQVRSEGRSFDAAITLDESRLGIKLNAIASEVSVQGRDASVVFTPDDMNFKDPEEPSERELAELNKMFTVNDEVPGLTVDVNMMAQKLSEDLKGDYKANQELIVTQYVPKTTAESLSKSFHYLATFRTKISSLSTDERVHNIKTALSKFNGIVLQPGQELSFNDTTGPRTEANGYQMAHVINNKAYVDDWGGGVCQASTTLYNAALLAGCEITDRGHHSIPSDYIKPLGFDAMVNYPNGDLKIRNTSDGPIYIKAWVSPLRNAYVMIFGEPLADNASVQASYKGCTRIDRYSEIIFQGEDPGIETLVDEKGEYQEEAPYSDSEPYMTMRAHPELRIDAYLIYYDANDREIGRKKLYQDHFDAVKGTQYVGKNPKPTKTPESSATSAP